MSIIIIATLDTKGIEANYVRKEVTKRGRSTIVIDCGILGIPAVKADISREEIAKSGGEIMSQLIAKHDKAYAQDAMIRGLVKVVQQLLQNHQVDGVIAIGGAQGTATATAAMRALPVGIPKVMVSTVACGQTTFGPYVGTKDILMFHSVADILGLNRVTKRILSQAAAAVVAMSDCEVGIDPDKELIAITQAGITTPGVMAVKSILEDRGFEVITFHCNGIGGQAMEELILDGTVKGLIDYSPHEISDMLFGGLMPAQSGRMSAAGKVGIPQIIAPGCTDIILHGIQEDLPANLSERACVRHTPTHTHVRTSPEEMWAVAQYIATHLNEASGPRAAIVPLQGFSMLNKAGEILYDEAANHAYLESLRSTLTSDVQLIEVDAHINDQLFAEATVQAFLSLREIYRQR